MVEGTLKKLLILASGDGTNAQAIAEACTAGRISAQVAAIGSNRPDAYVLQRASTLHVPSFALDHRAFPSREAFDRRLLEQVQSYAPDLVVLAGFMRILTPVFIAAYRGHLLNIHPSLLPLYPGLDTHARALAAGDREAGATVHFVTEDLDGGPPILQTRVATEAGDSPQTLAARVRLREHLIYPRAIELCLSGRVRLVDGRACLNGQPIAADGIQEPCQTA